MLYAYLIAHYLAEDYKVKQNFTIVEFYNWKYNRTKIINV